MTGWISGTVPKAVFAQAPKSAPVAAPASVCRFGSRDRLSYRPSDSGRSRVRVSLRGKGRVRSGSGSRVRSRSRKPEQPTGAASGVGPHARNAKLSRQSHARSGRNIPRTHRFWRQSPGSAPLRLGIPRLCLARAFHLKNHDPTGSGIGSGSLLRLLPPALALIPEAQGFAQKNFGICAPRCAADLAFPIERNPRRSRPYVEYFPIE